MKMALGTVSPHLIAEEVIITSLEAKLPAVVREAGASMHKR